MAKISLKNDLPTAGGLLEATVLFRRGPYPAHCIFWRGMGRATIVCGAHVSRDIPSPSVESAIAAARFGPLEWAYLRSGKRVIVLFIPH
jgi:hypothetical protein